MTGFIILMGSGHIKAQEYEIPKKEYRGVWMATVINLDWPASGDLHPRYQKTDLVNKIESLKEAGINVLYFQIRTEGDALYESDIEPWSKYLTGKEGDAPDPYWDPLSFAIEETHKRGMELHAWFNPYRAMRSVPSDFTKNKSFEGDESLAPFLNRYYDANNPRFKGTSQRDSMHVSNTHPEWLLLPENNSTGDTSIAIFDPGLPQVMDHVTGIIMDVVNRYDVDGVHFDDYFYPYPPNHMGAPNTDNESLDDSTFANYPRGFTDKDEWRRNNVDLLVEMIHDSIQVAKPWVKFGISPFGIWKNGVPYGTGGMDAYSVIYGDGLAWLEAQTIDYITPQLYWKIARYYSIEQDYKALADWWAEHAVNYGRHIYPGHGVYRTSSSTYSGTLFKANEIPRQITHNRSNPKIEGSVFFRTRNITTYDSQGFADSLKNNYYKYAALTPTMAWKDTTRPGTPENLTVTRDAEKEYLFHLNWDRPADAPPAKTSATGHADTLLKYAIYRVDAQGNPDEMAEMEYYYNLVGLTGVTEFTDNAPPSDNEYWYFVTAVTRNSVESVPTQSMLGGVVVTNEENPSLPEAYRLSQNYPNPFNPVTRIEFSLPSEGLTSLKVYDMLGREVETLIDKPMASGTHQVNFDASALSSGVYIYRLNSSGISLTKRMTLIK